MILRRNKMLLVYLIATFMFVGCENIIHRDGYVLDGKTNLPLDSVLVKSYYKGGKGKTYETEMLTDSTGYFTGTTGLVGCTGGCPDLLIELSKPGYTTIEVINPVEDTVYLSQ